MAKRKIQIMLEAEAEGNAEIIRSVIMTQPPSMVLGNGSTLSCVVIKTLEVYDDEYEGKTQMGTQDSEKSGTDGVEV